MHAMTYTIFSSSSRLFHLGPFGDTRDFDTRIKSHTVYLSVLACPTANKSKARPSNAVIVSEDEEEGIMQTVPYSHSLFSRSSSLMHNSYHPPRLLTSSAERTNYFSYSHFQRHDYPAALAAAVAHAHAPVNSKTWGQQEQDHLLLPPHHEEASQCDRKDYWRRCWQRETSCRCH